MSHLFLTSPAIGLNVYTDIHQSPKNQNHSTFCIPVLGASSVDVAQNYKNKNFHQKSSHWQSLNIAYKKEV